MKKYKNNELYQKIIEEIEKNSRITEIELADKYEVSERTMRRYFKDLKDNKKIKMLKRGKDREWKIL